MRPWAVVLVLSGVLLGCVHNNHFTYREDVALDEAAVRLGEGYYYRRYEYSIQGTTRQAIQPIILWKEGTAAFGHSWSDRGDSSSIEDAHVAFERRAQTLEGTRDDPVDWGAFRLSGDGRISIQVMRNFVSGGPPTYGVVEYEGQVLNDSTFVLTRLIAHLPRAITFGLLLKKEVTPIQRTYHFRRFDIGGAEKPSPSNWTDDFE